MHKLARALVGNAVIFTLAPGLALLPITAQQFLLLKRMKDRIKRALIKREDLLRTQLDLPDDLITIHVLFANDTEHQIGCATLYKFFANSHLAKSFPK